MRFRITLTLDFRIPPPVPASDEGSFWSRYNSLAKPDDPPITREVAKNYEAKLRTTFPAVLSAALAPSLGQVAVFVRYLEYRTVDIGMEMITGPLPLGFTTDDVLGLLMLFTPQALDATLPGNPSNFMTVAATGVLLDGGGALSPGSGVQAVGDVGRLGKAWWIANTSLVAVSVVLVVPAFLMFQSAQTDRNTLLTAANEERAKFAQGIIDQHRELFTAVNKERSDLKAERERVLESLTAQAKTMQDTFAASIKQLAEREELLVGLVKQWTPSREIPARQDKPRAAAAVTVVQPW